MSTINTDLQAARTALVDIFYQRSFLLSVPLARARERRHASDQRKAEHARRLGWISPEDALYIAGTDNPHDLNTALKTGRVRCRFWHRTRWWVWKEAEPREAIRLGSDGQSLVDDEHWGLRVHREDWCEYFGKPAAPASPADVPAPAAEKVQFRDATDDEIRVAMRAVYDEKGDERPDTKKIVPLVLDRLKASGLYARWRAVSEIAREPEFEERRNPPGPTRKSRTKQTK